MLNYDDNDFLDLLESVNWAPAYAVVNRLGCTFQTANRRLIQLAKEGAVEVLDPENDERGISSNETTSRPVIAYRLTDEMSERDSTDHE